jgi:hypothetical protein
VLAPHATQMGLDAEIDFGDGEVAHVPLASGRIGRWTGGTPRSAARPAAQRALLGEALP